MTAVKSSGAGSSKSVKSTALAEDAVEPHPGPAPESTAARDHDGFTPVFLFAHDYGTHLPYCEILQVETSIKCTCGFKEALEAALAAEALSRA